MNVKNISNHELPNDLLLLFDFFLLEIIYKIQVFTFVYDSTVLIFSTNKIVRKIMAKVVEIPHYIILKFSFFYSLVIRCF